MRIALLLVCIALTVSACSKSDTKTVPASDGGKAAIDTSQGKLEGASKDGQSAVAVGAGTDAAKIAERLPSYAPLYPGAEVTSFQSYDENDVKRRAIVMMLSADPPAKIAEFYRERMKASGRAKNDEVAAGDTVTLVSVDPDETGTSITISPEAGGSYLMLVQVDTIKK